MSAQLSHSSCLDVEVTDFLLLLRLVHIKLWEAGVLGEDTEGEDIHWKSLNMHRLGMKMTMRAQIMTHSGKYVRELLLH